MPILHKIAAGGVLSNYYNDKDGFREVKNIIINPDAVTIIENELFDKYPEFEHSLSSSINLKNLRITGNAHFFYPLHMEIEITDGCNLHCEYCYRNANSDFKHSNFVSWPRLKQVLFKLKEAGMDEIVITGGEATLHPYFESILVYVAKNFERVELITNGTNPEILKETLLKIPLKNRNRINLSISFNRWMHEYKSFLNGKHYLNKTITEVSKYRPIRILATDFLFNHKIYDLVSVKLIENGAFTTEYNIALPIGRGRTVTNAPEYLKLKNEVTLIDQTDAVEWQNIEWSPNCELVLRHATMNPVGDVRPCALFPVKKSTSFGNIFEKGMSLFENELVSRYFYMQAPSIVTCKNCELQRYCGNCIFRGLYGNGKRCAYKKENGV